MAMCALTVLKRSSHVSIGMVSRLGRGTSVTVSLRRAPAGNNGEAPKLPAAPSGAVFACDAIAPGQLYVVAEFSGHQLRYTITFDSAGVETGIEFGYLENLSGDPGNWFPFPVTLNYGPQSIGQPPPVITWNRWRTGIIKAYFPSLKTATVKAAQAKV